MSVHPIEVGQIEQMLSEFIGKSNYNEIMLLVDENTYRYCLPLIESVLDEYPTFVIADGEESKSIETIVEFTEYMLDSQVDRESLLINLGGGVVTDIGGLAASTYMRGIDFLHIPTSLLAMVDASLGGKCGVNIAYAKNIFGVFSMPVNVLIDPTFLHTLSRDELISGWGEVIKHGVISGGELWESIYSQEVVKENINADWIEKIASVKMDIVAQDMKEKGIRMYLNLGHTLGHALESLRIERGDPIHHGHAIAIGILWESILSHKSNLLAMEELNEIVEVIEKDFELIAIDVEAFNSILHFMQYDKKRKKGMVQFALPERIGAITIKENIGERKLRECNDFYMKKYVI